MIPVRYIQEWKQYAPWVNEAQVEQDLIISRALVEMFQSPLLQDSLAFRGGTALHKLYIQPQVRYSEDIDLVQVNPEPIKPILQEIRQKLSFLGMERTVRQNVHNNTILYRFKSEIPPVINMRLKIEINTREHFDVLGLRKLPFQIKNNWYSGDCNVTTYQIEELLGTKVRALYQRRKGRDLFDLYWTLSQYDVDPDIVIKCYNEYMNFSVETPPTKKLFLLNMEEKLQDNEFLTDMEGIKSPGVDYSIEEAWSLVRNQLIEKLK